MDRQDESARPAGPIPPWNSPSAAGLSPCSRNLDFPSQTSAQPSLDTDSLPDLDELPPVGPQEIWPDEPDIPETMSTCSSDSDDSAMSRIWTSYIDLAQNITGMPSGSIAVQLRNELVSGDFLVLEGLSYEEQPLYFAALTGLPIQNSPPTDLETNHQPNNDAAAGALMPNVFCDANEVPYDGHQLPNGLGAGEEEDPDGWGFDHQHPNEASIEPEPSNRLATGHQTTLAMNDGFQIVNAVVDTDRSAERHIDFPSCITRFTRPDVMEIWRVFKGGERCPEVISRWIPLWRGWNNVRSQSGNAEPPDVSFVLEIRSVLGWMNLCESIAYERDLDYSLSFSRAVRLRGDG
ncbi:MAG: hypothetical protein M1837_000048 [Sclerophora amabilis]|nr:MAG: hypothetical protein M1837_000048 [Sclerophora amabilis]